MRHSWSTLAVAAALAIVATGASADIIFTPSPGSNTGTDNVVFNSCSGIITGPALMVQGCLNSSTSTIVDFTGTENLVVNGGQARIEAQDGSFNSLTTNLDPLATSAFTSLIFNINTALGDSGTITINVQPIAEALVSQSFAVANGQNFFRIDAINGELIQFVNFLSTGIGMESVSFDDVRQVRIGGVATPLPEPGVLGLLGMVLGVVGLTARRRHS